MAEIEEESKEDVGDVRETVEMKAFRDTFTKYYKPYADAKNFSNSDKVLEDLFPSIKSCFKAFVLFVEDYEKLKKLLKIEKPQIMVMTKSLQTFATSVKETFKAIIKDKEESAFNALEKDASDVVKVFDNLKAIEFESGFKDFGKAFDSFKKFIETARGFSKKFKVLELQSKKNGDFAASFCKEVEKTLNSRKKINEDFPKFKALAEEGLSEYRELLKEAIGKDVKSVEEIINGLKTDIKDIKGAKEVFAKDSLIEVKVTKTNMLGGLIPLNVIDILFPLAIGTVLGCCIYLMF